MIPPAITILTFNAIVLPVFAILIWRKEARFKKAVMPLCDGFVCTDAICVGKKKLDEPLDIQLDRKKDTYSKTYAQFYYNTWRYTFNGTEYVIIRDCEEGLWSEIGEMRKIYVEEAKPTHFNFVKNEYDNSRYLKTLIKDAAIKVFPFELAIIIVAFGLAGKL